MKLASNLAVALAALLMLSSLPVSAALPTIAAPAPAQSTSSAAQGLLQAGGGMLLVLGLILLCAWLARRFGLQRLGGGRLVRVVSSAALGTRERVVVVEVAGTWLVLGVTPSQVNTLHTMPATTVADGADEPRDPLRNMFALFSGKLREAASARTGAPT